MLALVLFQALVLALCAAAQSSNPGTNSTANSTTLNSQGRYPLTADGSCGSTVGRMCLMNGTSPCCSTGGFCGNGDEYCSTKQGCQGDYGKCQSNDASLGNPQCSWSGEGTSPRCDGRCGSAFNNAICSSNANASAFVMYGVYDYGHCCSSAGFCGSSKEHCEQGCQSGCDKNSTQPSSSAPPPAATTSASAAERHGVLPSGVAFAFFSVVGVMLGF